MIIVINSSLEWILYEAHWSASVGPSAGQPGAEEMPRRLCLRPAQALQKNKDDENNDKKGENNHI